MELARATSANEECLAVASHHFINRFASQRFNFSTDPDSLEILKYFGGFIHSMKLYFADADNCDSNQTSQYRRLLQYSNRYRVFDFEISGKLCGLNLFHEIKEVVYAETVVINQKAVTIDTGRNLQLCKIFPEVRSLELNIESINDRSFIDCEFIFLDELTIGGIILDETFDETFKNLLMKNSLIQSIAFKGPTNQRTFQLVKKYLRNVKYIGIFDRVHEFDDNVDEISFPNVRKLEFRHGHGSECQLPMLISFGGDELQELSLNCYESDRNFRYFSTLYRYPNIKSLNAGYDLQYLDLKRITGKFPLLVKANFSILGDNIYPEPEANMIKKFIEKCNQLEEMTFMYSSKSDIYVQDLMEEASRLENWLKEEMGNKFTVHYHINGNSSNFQLKKNGCAIKRVKFSVFSFLLIVCAFFF